MNFTNTTQHEDTTNQSLATTTHSETATTVSHFLRAVCRLINLQLCTDTSENVN
jgi:hypothetical protein